MPKLILDVMGGDYAPQANLDGALQALPSLEDELVLVADKEAIKPFLSKLRYRALDQALKQGYYKNCKISLLHAAETIDMADSIRAIRSKPGASINVGCRLAAKDWKEKTPSAFISAGHSGAMMASALLNMGRLPGIERPAIAVKLPTLSTDGCIILDVGANVDCKPEHLRDFAMMGAEFAKVERQNPALPKVALLSNGEELSKGNELTRAALALIKDNPCFNGKNAIGNFIGYSEGKDFFKGSVDVVVADGFVGNVVLKSIEGLGSAVTSILKKEAKRNPISTLGFILSASVFTQLKRKLDYAEYGAAPLLGVSGYAFICHGRSNGKAIKNALLRSEAALKSKYIENLETALKKHFESKTEEPQS